MKKLIILTVLAIIFISQVFAQQIQAEISQPPTSQLNDVFRQLGQLDGRLSNSEKEIAAARNEAREAFIEAQSSEKYLWVMVTLLSMFFIGIYVYLKSAIAKNVKTISDTLAKQAEERLSKESKEQFERFAEKLSEEARLAVQNIEDKHFQYMQITSLRFSRQYDDALKFVGWSGDYKSYSEYPDAVQRSLVACVCNSQKMRQNKEHIKAWEWARALVDKDASVGNVITMIKTGNTLKNWDEVIKLFDRISGRLNDQEKERCEPYLFVSFRHACDPDYKDIYARRLRSIAEKNQGTKDIKFKTTLAAFYRDEGRFEDAELVMNPEIRQYTGSSNLPEGWDKLFNTFLANAIDQGKPESAISQARTMLSQPLTPDLIFNCARLAWRLPSESNDRADIFRLINRRHDDGLMPERDDGTIKTLAILKEIEGRCSDAEEALKSGIDEMARGTGSWSNYQHYYYKCMLAEIYESRTEVKAWDKAVDLLEAITGDDKIGEATYLLAKAYALKKESRLMERYLEAAGKTRRKWIMKAKHDQAFTSHHEIDELLSKYVKAV